MENNKGLQIIYKAQIAAVILYAAAAKFIFYDKGQKEVFYISVIGLAISEMIVFKILSKANEKRLK